MLAESIDATAPTHAAGAQRQAFIKYTRRAHNFDHRSFATSTQTTSNALRLTLSSPTTIMNLPTYATLIIAAAFATANGAETKQHVRKAQGDVAEKLTEAIEVREDIRARSIM